MKRRTIIFVTTIILTFLMLAGCMCGKSDQDAPSVAVESKTDTVIIIKAVSGAEYSKNDGGAWQSSNIFTGLLPNTTYKVTARLKETDRLKASPKAAAQSVTTSTLVSGIEITENPTVKLNHGAEPTVTGGKIAHKLSYAGKEYLSEIAIDKDWLEFDLAGKSFKVSYEGEMLEGSFAEDFGMGNKAVTVSNAAQLTNALRSDSAELIIVNGGNYELNASGTTTYVEKAKTIIGKGEAKIKITGQVSGQASIIFKDNTTIKNITFENVDEKSPVKFSTITAPLQMINKIKLDNVRIIGKSGVNIHGVKAAELNNVSISLAENSYGVALAIREAAVSIKKSAIGKGTWGSAGVMYGAGDSLSSRLTVDSDSTFAASVYVENYSAYSEEEIIVVTGLTGWVFAVNENDQGIYTKP